MNTMNEILEKNKLVEILEKPIEIGQKSQFEFRAWHLFNYVEELLKERVDHKIILDIIDFVKSQPAPRYN